MKTNPKSAHVRRIMFVSTALLATATIANAADYEFKVTKGSIPGQTATIELIDTETGQVVTGADIYVVHTTSSAQEKGKPGIHVARVPLAEHLSGKCPFLKGKPPLSGELTLTATVPGKFWPVWRLIYLSN